MSQNQLTPTILKRPDSLGAPEHDKPQSNESTKPRVLIIVSGGVADYVCDPGLDIEIFDRDNYDAESDEGRNSMGAPSHFADLAAPCGIPVCSS